ncbi:MAG: hypothetical protein A2Z27_04850 [candidate division Zixibacteria bacterium RBG_16_50_21]|nr:MAG: hypothetical protein A2Z27_04850 [candidate division Zixibacteria bacterium RBG_16_50_21]
MELGTLIRMRLLPMKSKVNLTPLVGHKLYREIGRIYDPEGEQPDSLDFGYSDNGMLYGLDFLVALKKIEESSDLRLTLGYIYEDLKKKADRFRIELGIFSFFGRGKSDSKQFFEEFGTLSMRFEYADWRDGRNSWFLTISLSA